MLATPQSEPGAPEVSDQARKGDDIVIYPYLFSPAPILPDKIDFTPSLCSSLLKGAHKDARASGAQLSSARDALSRQLDGSAAAADLRQAQERYLSCYLAFFSPDEESGVSLATVPPPLLGLCYSWQGASLSAPAYELAYVLLSGAVARARCAARIAPNSASGVRTPGAVEAYRLLLAAAGQLEYAAHVLVPQLDEEGPGIVSLIEALQAHCLAEAQYLTVLRAARKGSSASLVAALAAEAASLYDSAANNRGDAQLRKLACHAAYKRNAMRATSLAFWAAGCRQESSASPADISSMASRAEAMWREDVRSAASAFDAAPPATLNLDHRRPDDVRFKYACLTNTEGFEFLLST